MEFEWDSRKAQTNLARHGIAFEHARLAFEDLHAIESINLDSAEERWRLIGRAGVHLLTVIYAERGNRIRIISARRATKREQATYHEQSR